MVRTLLYMCFFFTHAYFLSLLIPCFYYFLNLPVLAAAPDSLHTHYATSQSLFNLITILYIYIPPIIFYGTYSLYIYNVYYFSIRLCCADFLYAPLLPLFKYLLVSSFLKTPVLAAAPDIIPHIFSTIL